MKILSTHLGHDPNITFLNEDNIIHIEEERISRIKHLQNVHSIKVLNELKENFNYDIKVSSISFEDFDTIETTFKEKYKIKNKEINISHHLAHAAYAYYTRPEEINECDILVIDGWGWETDRYFFNKKMELIDNSVFGIGFLWTLTSLAFYDKLYLEGKMMGMAAFGDINKDIIRQYNKARFIIKKSETIEKRKRKKEKEKYVSEAREIIFNIFKNNKPEDIIRSLQSLTENEIINYLIENKTSNNLVVAGGLFLNGYLNQKLFSIYEKVHIPPATSDSGISIGGALLLSKKRLYNPVYIGRKHQITNDIFDIIKKTNMKHFKLNYDYIADKIIEGKIIALYQGRSESGPRALGNRSILADPRSGAIKKYINKYIKKREWYRPYAPVILEEKVSEWFENVETSKWMTRIVKYRKGKGELVAGVCHKDYTGRLQSVSIDDNKRLYLIIKSFFNKTKIPILLNTSFNVKEPIVDTPIDALKTYIESNIDILILEDNIIEKQNDRFIVSNL